VRSQDECGNAIVGRAEVVESSGNVVHSDGPTVVLYGVDNLVVVAHHGVVLVTTVERSGDLAHLVERLPPSVRGIE
jgi:mannose-1-phosphate guanylyltransferase